MGKRKKLMGLFVAIGVVFAATSCLKSESDYDKQVKIDDKILADFIASQSITAQKHSTGFYYQVIHSQDGGQQLKKDDVVSFDYSIYTLSGSLIQTNTDEDGLPAVLKLQTMTVIPEALDYGVSLMKVGDRYRFFVPSYLAYGSYSTEEFSAHTNFIIDVEVKELLSESEIESAQIDSISNYVAEHYPDYQQTESGLFFVDSLEGAGVPPMDGSAVIVDVKRKYLDGTLTMANTDATIYLDRGWNAEGLEEGLKMMKPNGAAILIMPASIAFGNSVCVIPQKERQRLFEKQILTHNIEPYSILKYVVKVKSIMH